MKKLLLIGAGLMLLGACAFHAKQPVDDTYYKKTQSIAWPESATTAAASGTSVQKSTAGGTTAVPSSAAAEDPTKWHDPQPDLTPKVAVPKDPGLKLQCTKKDGAYTCRKGQYTCGTGCKSDGSNCNNGVCLESECADIMGQKWDLVRDGNYFACKHPTYDVKCRPDYGAGIMCERGGIPCGFDCNANGTQCQRGDNDCWDKYR